MSLINTLGAIGEGYNKGRDALMKEETQKRENAIKDFQIKKLQREEAADQRWLPVSKLWPKYQEMPETMGFMKNLAGENGLEGDIKEVGGNIYMRQGAAKELMTMIALQTDLQEKQNKAIESDMSAKYIRLKQQAGTGKNAEGKPLKPEELESLNKELRSTEEVIGGILQLRKTAEMKIKLMEQQAKGRETKPNQFRDTQTNELVNSDKNNRFWKANSGEEYTGNTANLKPVAEESAANVRAVPTSVTINKVGGGEKTYKPSNIEIMRKNPKGVVEREVVDRNSADYGKKVKEGWAAASKPRYEDPDDDDSGTMKWK
jgi:hypothetical protein